MSFQNLQAYQAVRRQILKRVEQEPYLGMLVQEEKDVVASVSTFRTELDQASEYLAKWGAHEHEDLKEVTSKMHSVNSEFMIEIARFTRDYTISRSKFKGIIKAAANVHEVEKQHKIATEKLHKLTSAGRPVDIIQKEEEFLLRQVSEHIAKYETLKRELFREAIAIQSQSWVQLSRSISIMATFQQHLYQQIPRGTLTPGEELPVFKGAATVENIWQDFTSEIEGHRQSMQSTNTAAVQSAPAPTHNQQSQRAVNEIKHAEIELDMAKTRTKALHNYGGMKIDISQRNGFESISNQREDNVPRTQHELGNDPNFVNDQDRNSLYNQEDESMQHSTQNSNQWHREEPMVPNNSTKNAPPPAPRKPQHLQTENPW